MRVSRELEIKHELERALEHTDERRINRAEPIIYEDGDLARKIGDVLALAKTYNVSTLGELNAFLQLYNVEIEQTDNDKKRGLTYSIIKDGKRIGRPMIATKIHGGALASIEKHLQKNKKTVVLLQNRTALKPKIDDAIRFASNYDEFKIALEQMQVRTVERIGKDGKILGVTFEDDENKVISNGSSIGREYSYLNIVKNFMENAESEQSDHIECDYYPTPVPELIEVDADVEKPKKETEKHIGFASYVAMLVGGTLRKRKKKR